MYDKKEKLPGRERNRKTTGNDVRLIMYTSVHVLRGFGQVVSSMIVLRKKTLLYGLSTIQLFSITVLVIIKLTKFPVPLRFRCGPGKLK